MSSENNKCPICNGSTKLTNSYFNVTECNRCVYQISDYTKGDITKALKMDEIGIKDYATNYESSKDYNDATALCIEVAKKAYKGEFSDIDIPRSIISYALRNGKKDQFIDTQSLVKILKNKSLPTPAELANNFILFLGDRLSSPSDFYNVLLAKGVKENICGLLGIKTGKNEWNDLRFVIKSLEEQEIINSNYKTDDTKVQTVNELFLCGTLETIFEFIIFCSKYCNIKNKYPSKANGKNLYQVHYYSEDASKIIKLLYEDSSTYLERKYQKYLTIIK